MNFQTHKRESCLTVIHEPNQKYIYLHTNVNLQIQPIPSKSSSTIFVDYLKICLLEKIEKINYSQQNENF